ncbi:MAG TPA: TRAP transporter substrate-binding protein DctP [Polyangiaceae bacterium]|jgi:TRAP-type C4-dicarboxylate transport system substrate-binding protein|nr:TRAP transporter substrate-binding protein DctP [Polyangiaceae bacterium]
MISARLRLVTCAAALALCTAGSARATQTIRLATIAPRTSTWGKVLEAWQKAVEQKTDGQIALNIYYNGVQGDERTVVSKIKTGELDGAALSSIGLSHVFRDVMVLQLPGVTNSWPLADLVRGMLKDPIEQGFRTQGFELLSWGDIGLVYQFTKGVEVRGPTDLRGKRPMVFRNEPMAPLFFSLIGQIVPVPLDITEVLPALQAGTVNVVGAPALAAEQLQWVPYLDHINDQPIVAAIGATLMKEEKLEAIPADTRALFRDMQRRAAKVQSDRIRQLDMEARDRLMKRMTVVTPTDDDKIEWYRMFLKAVKRLRNGVFSKPLIDQVLSITGKG